MGEEITNKDAAPARLDEIPTQWSLLRLAHQSTVTAAGPARHELVLRYARAIRNYVGALVRDPHDADELAQEVVVRLLRGQFASATPERGRFRHLLTVAAHNLVRTYWAKKKRNSPLDLDVVELAEEAADRDAEAIASWRQAVLELAWHGLKEYEQTHPGSVAWTLLRLRADHPADDSEQLAARLSQKTGRPFRADTMRQQLRRARVRFAQILLEEVARGLDEPTPERVQEELGAIGLLEYVQDFLPPNWRTRGELSEEA